jgi:L-arabinose transport system substrate-binding protein
MPVVSSDAPTATQSVGGPQYVVINPPGGEYGNLQNSFIQTANALGADAQKYDDLYDANASISQVNNTIKAGARGIAIQSFAPLKTGPAVAKAAKTAGVVLVAIESPIMDANGKRVPLIRYDDDTEMGKKVGDAASKLLAEIGWLKDSTRKVGVLSLEVNSQPFCNIRTDNAKVAIKNAGIPDKQIFPLQYDVIKVDSQDTTGAILSAHPDITNWVVFSCTDSGIAGSLKAFAAAGVKTEDILGIGIGAYEACIPWAAGQPTGFKASLNISTQDMGKTAATLLNDMVVNSKIPPGRHNSLYNYRGCHELQDNHGSGFAS